MANYSRALRTCESFVLSRCCGATIVNDPEELRPEDVGTGAGIFEVKKIGDEYSKFHLCLPNVSSYTADLYFEILHICDGVRKSEGLHHSSKGSQQRCTE